MKKTTTTKHVTTPTSQMLTAWNYPLITLFQPLKHSSNHNNCSNNAPQEREEDGRERGNIYKGIYVYHMSKHQLQNIRQYSVFIQSDGLTPWITDRHFMSPLVLQHYSFQRIIFMCVASLCLFTSIACFMYQISHMSTV